MSAHKVVIVGGGQAGFQVAASLRAGKFAGPVAILGEETALPYQRPPLSKGYIKGEASASSVLLPRGGHRPGRVPCDAG